MALQKYSKTLPSSAELEAQNDDFAYYAEGYALDVVVHPDGAVTFVMMDTSLTQVARSLMGDNGKVLS